MAMWLFTYGTLTRRGRMEALAGRRLAEPVAATLRGYRKHDTPHGYPIILPDARACAQVEGLLWEVERTDLPALDHYEGTDETPPFYYRRDVEVEVAGAKRAAQVFVGNPDAIWPARTES
jgi:gamma-glutamylcyclotransferase (GGCT)/AIG2-like uncharacterized protein YtfP